MSRRAAVLALVLCALTALSLPSLAAADGDPASDVLLGQNVFYPYTPVVSRAIQTKLNAETAAAKQAGFPIKVALIAAPTDLGVLPSLFGKPQSYASFLDKEISFQGPQPVLVVMAAGYGVAGVKAPGSLALKAIAKPAGKTSNDLALAAITAVGKLAAASGHPLSGQASGGSSGKSAGSGSGTTVLLIVLVLAAVLVATALLVLRARQAAR